MRELIAASKTKLAEEQNVFSRGIVRTKSIAAVRTLSDNKRRVSAYRSAVEWDAKSLSMVGDKLRQSKFSWAKRTNEFLEECFQKWEKVRENSNFFHMHPVNCDSATALAGRRKFARFPIKIRQTKKY